ncbi:hypothetical protein LINJ_32_1580 [Leishmania infantum JPCM5]|uniref:Uncharacterized protein n=2 Tax=Leishmania infantum TaxID=5671 RepID=A4I7W6_LEIIN|nr:hypothetical protein LINJ_32_1580 [Leishmania infantum JPCM5]CAC9524738.1 hypothetical_protein [Leishmania infantum]CAM70902.1 hypothetical protein LINJ_32_1580 [Leishmania infantum JPCM5]SUZ44722.1 hypothetical_protein [Leishmania infantum]|eukprot:XP_001467835.1 hypothetical protein LINJ_32_1580 [Leishmania infantum JPCM5]
MSTSAAPPMITCFGVLQDEQQRGSVLEAERIPHLIPVLEGLHRGHAAEVAGKSSVMAVAHRLREEGGPDSVKLQPIRWRGKAEDSIRAQLQPVLAHYRSHILFVQERTRRRVLECEELAARVPLVTDYYQSTPLKWRLRGYMSDWESLEKADLEYIPGTAAGVVTTMSEALRDRQFREAFQRFESVLQSRDSISGASSAVREDAGSIPGLSSLAAYNEVPFSPPPRAPSGYSEAAPMEESAADNALGSAVAHIGPLRHK